MNSTFCLDTEYTDINAVADEHPGADHIEVVEGGWHVFYTDSDYQTWLKQI